MKFIVTCLAGGLILLAGVSCAPAGLPAAPALRTVEVTRLATHEVTVEVTRFLELPVTDTPMPGASPTPTPTPTPTQYLSPTRTRVPSITPTFTPPYITILVDTGCYYGPSPEYLLKYGLFTLNSMTAVGRNPDGIWLNIKSQNDPLWNACWIRTDQVRFDTGSLGIVPIVWMTYPYSILYQPPTVVSASRTGNDVTVSWQPAYMTEDDYRGYMIEAWVCRGGKQVFVPKSYVTSFNTNNTVTRMSVTLTDEPGCDVPSNARLYGVEKHGYTGYREITWPQADTAGTPSATQAPTPTP